MQIIFLIFLAFLFFRVIIMLEAGSAVFFPKPREKNLSLGRQGLCYAILSLWSISTKDRV